MVIQFQTFPTNVQKEKKISRINMELNIMAPSKNTLILLVMQSYELRMLHFIG